MKPKKRLSVYVLLVGLMSLLIVGGMVAFQIVKEATSSQLSNEQKEAVKPLDGKIDEAVVLNLSERTTFTNEELRFVPFVVDTLLVVPTINITAPSTVSAELSSSSAEIIK